MLPFISLGRLSSTSVCSICFKLSIYCSMLAYYLLLLAYPIHCSLLAYCSTHATGSLLACLFAPCAPQLSPHSPICSMHAVGSLLACLFAPCMPQALSFFAYLLHACYRLHPCLPICLMHATGSPFLTHLLYACYELSVAMLPHACPSVRAVRRQLSSSRPDRRTTSPRSSLGTPGPSPTTPTNA